MMKLGSREIHLWLTWPFDVRDAALLEAYSELLDEGESGRWRRFVFERHRHVFLVTRALVRSVLGNYESTPAADLVFSFNGHGKPDLEGREGPGSRRFNVSHTEGLIALAVVLDREIGVDVEYVDRKADILKLAQRYFSPAEYRDMDELAGNKQVDRFFDLWTLKEAYIKAHGLGLAIPLEDFCFSFDGARISIAFSPQRNDSPDLWRFWQMRPDSGHKLALAVTGADLDGLRVICRRGVPMGEFREIPCEIVRTSVGV